MKERILLVNSIEDRDKARPPHLGIAYLHAYLSEKGIDAEIFDSRFNGEDIIEKVQEYSPGVIGFSSMTANLETTLDDLSRVSEFFPELLTVFGGVHPTVRPHDVLKSKNQIVVHGEGEITLHQLVRQYFDGEKDFHKIKGISFLNEDNRIIYTGNSPLIPNLDNLPLPSIDRYFGNKKVNQFQIMSSRGCPYRCDFCSSEKMWHRRIRMHSPGRVLDEIQRLADNDVFRFLFVDDALTINAKRLYEICSGIIEKGYPISWTANSRVDFLPNCDKGELLLKMKKAGCFLICYGVESGSQKILDRIHKGITLDQAREAIAITKEAGINTKANFIVGLPGSFKEQLKVIDFVKETLPDYITFHYYVPLPGTRMVREAYKYGLQIDENVVVEDFRIDIDEPLVSYRHPEFSLTTGEIVEAMRVIVGEMEKLGYSSRPRHGERIMKSPLASYKEDEETPSYFSLLKS